MTDQDSPPPTQPSDLKQLEEQYTSGLISRQAYYQRKRLLISGHTGEGMSTEAKVVIGILVVAVGLVILGVIFMNALVCADSPGMC